MNRKFRLSIKKVDFFPPIKKRCFRHTTIFHNKILGVFFTNKKNYDNLNLRQIIATFQLNRTIQTSTHLSLIWGMSPHPSTIPQSAKSTNFSQWFLRKQREKSTFPRLGVDIPPHPSSLLHFLPQQWMGRPRMRPCQEFGCLVPFSESAALH